MPLKSLHRIRLNSLNRLLPYLGAQELTIQGRGGTVTTTKIDPPPWVLRQFQPGTKLGPIGHTISFIANWSLLAPYGSYGPCAAVRTPRSVGRGLQANQAPFGLIQLGQRGKLASPQGQVGPKPQFDPPEPKLVTNPLDPKLANNLLDTNLAINPVGPIFGHGPLWTIFPAIASGNHQRPPDQLSKRFPQLKGNSFFPPCTPYSRFQVCVHIWYYIPLCTIFTQQSNGDVFRTKFHNLKSRSQNPTPIWKEDSSTHQSGNLWRQSEDHSRTPTTWPCRSWVGHFIQNYSKGILRGYKVFQSVYKASSISITLGQLIWSIQASIKQPVCPWPNCVNSTFHCGNSITQFIFKMARTVLAQLRQYSWCSTFQDQSFSFSHILATLQHLVTFSPVN
ncbi:hypothetical protein O181_122137 [Austropuccinia psidii MF-1]|uniref:Uncharacterized protein n=1 Tax=Austropuccinia psidii MF-1 TaxID=1389203 RepID=A0A9Q3KMH0_9BASI|nr:hypothetical protein [Austropuccinia psidii MF-1]